MSHQPPKLLRGAERLHERRNAQHAIGPLVAPTTVVFRAIPPNHEAITSRLARWAFLQLTYLVMYSTRKEGDMDQTADVEGLIDALIDREGGYVVNPAVQ